MSFKADGKMTVDFANDGVVEVYMTYEMDGDQVSVVDKTPGSACYDQTGVYKVAISDTEMNVEVVTDPCDERRGDGTPMTMNRSQ